ncbi:MAG: hypothetical protein B7Y39_10010 [Bdellovibrio sp. 28-41-41]|nr:MAG: hypothetical protein B7Y39_10010 [Bdellovibrio sp. 28-41-41]
MINFISESPNKGGGSPPPLFRSAFLLSFSLEGQQFTELYPKFKKRKIQIFGISRDSVKSHDKFKCKYEFPFELLSDKDEVLCKFFDVIKEKNMYGKKVLGIERSTFILDEDGKLTHEFRGIKADGHAQAMLEQI